MNDTERLDWLLSIEGRSAIYWAVENGVPFTREDIDAKMPVEQPQEAP